MTMRTLYVFLAMAFGITWGIAAVAIAAPDFVEATFGELSLTNPLFLVAVYAPAIAAVILVTYHGGARGLARYLSRLTYWRCSPWWYAFIFVGIPALVYAAVAMKGTLGEEPFPFDPWYAAIPALALALVIGPIEEFGWRGLALPLLQRRFTPVSAAMILGTIWAIWHIPAFLVSGTPQSTFAIVPFLLAIVAVSIIMTALFNASNGSFLLVALVHFQLNNPVFPDAQPYDLVTFGVAAAAVLLVYRRVMFAKTGVTEVMPDAAAAGGRAVRGGDPHEA